MPEETKKEEPKPKQLELPILPSTSSSNQKVSSLASPDDEAEEGELIEDFNEEK